jgi:WD40 repeat protein
MRTTCRFDRRCGIALALLLLCALVIACQAAPEPTPRPPALTGSPTTTLTPSPPSITRLSDADQGATVFANATAVKATFVADHPTMLPEVAATRQAVALATIWAKETVIAKTPTSTPTPLPPSDSTPTPTPQPFTANDGARPLGALMRLGIGYIIDSDLSPDGTLLALGTSTGIYVYRVDGFERVWRHYTRLPVRSVAWSPDGMRLLTGSGIDGDLILWNTTTGEKVRQLDGWHDGAWSPDGSMIAVEIIPPHTSEEQGCGVQIYDGWNGLPLRTLNILLKYWYGRSIWDIAWSLDSRTLAASTFDSTVYLWDAQSGDVLHKFDTSGCSSGFHKLVFNPDGTQLAALQCGGASSGDALAWDVKSGKEIQGVVQGFPAPRVVEWSPDETRVALIDDADDSELVVVDTDTGQPIYRAPGDAFGISWSPDGTRLALFGYMATTVLDVADGKRLMVLAADEIVPHLIWLPDSRRALAIYLQDVTVLDTPTGQILQGFSTYLPVNNVAWLPDGKMLALSGSGGYHFWELTTGQVTQTPPAGIDVPSLFTSQVNPPQVQSPDGKLIATGEMGGGCGDGPYGGGCFKTRGSVIIRDAVTDEELVEVSFPSTGITSLVWSPDGTMLAVGLGRSVYFWPDDLAATGIADNEIVVIDPITGNQLLRLPGHSGNVLGLAFSPDGQRLASASSDGTVILWDVTQ